MTANGKGCYYRRFSGFGLYRLMVSSTYIDPFDYSRLKEYRKGEVPVSALSRLVDWTADTSGVLRWELVGGADHLGHAQLTLSVAGTVQLECQRCLTPYAFEVASTSVLILAKDDESADAIEEALNNEEVDVVVASEIKDILQLVEDEILLEIPDSPKHEVCPDASALEALKANKKESPFAVLKNLK
ncbi:MAG: YceD family protein [Glaciimonas sp.]|nr:YceD family protein [Glaciimonas sp.]